MGIMEDGAGTFHDSGSDLKTYSGGEGPAADESGAAKCWDIDAADIIMCKHPDGSDWLLSSSESGQVGSTEHCQYCWHRAGHDTGMHPWIPDKQ